MLPDWLKAEVDEEGIPFWSNPGNEQLFVVHYVTIREKEGRVLKDGLVPGLPDLPVSHPLRSEWKLRKKTLDRFVKYLQDNPPKGPVLDLGCGNGWFTNHLTKHTDQLVIGMDVNVPELQQATAVFQTNDRLQFGFGKIFEVDFPAGTFGMITVNAAIQYFPDLRALVDKLLHFLQPGGEIHFLDSPFYEGAELSRAKTRSEKHYQTAGIPEMANHYFHHSLTSLKLFKPEIMHESTKQAGFLGKMKSLFAGKDSPFPWIRIKKS